ncbi:hypothetical protein LCGC14_1555570, partial [marine sediment metagenome]
GFTIIDGYADFGGAIECDGASPTINNCVFENNAAELDGGAIDIFYGSPQITDCVFRGNMATGYGDSVGGGIECYKGTPTIKNCLFVDNSVSRHGGAIDLYDSNATITNCTVVGNNALAGTGGIYASDLSTPTITNSIFRDNAGDLSYVIATVTYSCIESGDPGVGNITDDPMFREGLEGDYYLSQIDAGQLVDSPCINVIAGSAMDFTDGVYTTKTNNDDDADDDDMGYHYRNNDPVPMFALITQVDGVGGTIDPPHAAPGNGYVQFSDIELTATVADDSYRLDAWSGTNDDARTEPNNVVTMTTDPNTVKVSFVKKTTYALTTEVVGGVGGDIDPNAIPESRSYYEGEVAEVTAIPNSGYVVKNWDIDGANQGHSDPNLFVTMDSPKHVKVEFIYGANTRRLTTRVIGGNGTVEPERRSDHAFGSVVEVVAHPDNGFQVKSWKIDGVDAGHTNPNHFVTMDSGKIVTVEFGQPLTGWLETYVIDVGNGANGTITPLSGVISTFIGDVTTVTANPAAGYHVRMWNTSDFPGVDIPPVTGNTITVTMQAFGTYVGVEFARDSLPTGTIEIRDRNSGAVTQAASAITIQAAINAAIADTANFDFVNTFPEIVVAPGLYQGPGNRDLDLRGFPMDVTGELGPDLTIIDCQTAGRGFVFSDGSFNNGISPEWKIEGFTIINGHVEASSGFDYGGAILFDGTTSHFEFSMGEVVDCIFQNNFATDGGGAIACLSIDYPVDDPNEVHTVLIDLPRPTIRIHDCKISNNTTNGDGGGIYTDLSSPVISSTEIGSVTTMGNNATGSGPGFGHGGGIYCQNGRTATQADQDDFNGVNYDPPIVSMPEIVNCLITNNIATHMGGGIYAVDCAPYINMSTIAFNNGLSQFDGIRVDYFDDSEPIMNSIVWHPGNDTISDDLFNIDAEFSCIEDGDGGNGNIAANPGFLAGPLGNYYLSQAGASVNGGQGVPAFNVVSAIYNLGSLLTTDSVNAFPDTGNMDMGYHYSAITKTRVVFLTLNTSADGSLQFGSGGITYGVIPPSSQAVFPVVLQTPSASAWFNLLAIPDAGHRVANWIGTNNDILLGNLNSVTVTGDPTIINNVWVNFELLVPRTLYYPQNSKYNTLQDAIDDAKDGDEIEIAIGKHAVQYDPTQRDLGYVVTGKDITIRSAKPDNQYYIDNTII